MTEVVPAILAKDFEELREKLAKITGVTHLVQVDICDGKFVPSISWPFDKLRVNPSYYPIEIERILSEEEGLPYWDSLDFEFDLMAQDAYKQFEFFIRLGAKRIIFHLEAEGEGFKEFLEGLDMYTRDNIQIGLAINTTTDIEKLSPFINLIDFVQCMGIAKIGYQGEPFDERVLEQIKNLRRKYPELIISIDGSVNENTAPLLVEAGANRLIVGSLLMNSYDVKETIKELENL